MKAQQNATVYCEPHLLSALHNRGNSSVCILSLNELNHVSANADMDMTIVIVCQADDVSKYVDFIDLRMRVVITGRLVKGERVSLHQSRGCVFVVPWCKNEVFLAWIHLLTGQKFGPTHAA